MRKILTITAILMALMMVTPSAQRVERAMNNVSGNLIVSQYATVGNLGSIGNNDDTITFSANRSDSGAPSKHAIGISAYLYTPWTANAGAKNSVLYDSLHQCAPRVGVTVPECITYSENRWIGDSADTQGTIDQLIGINVNNVVTIGGTPTINRNYGIVIKDQSSHGTRNAAVLTANNNWFKWLNAAGDTDINAIRVTTSNRLEFGTITQRTIAYANTTGNITTELEIADGTITRTLPTAASCTGCLIQIRNLTGTVTIASAGGAIVGTTTIAAGVSRRYTSTGADWFEF